MPSLDNIGCIIPNVIVQLGNSDNFTIAVGKALVGTVKKVYSSCDKVQLNQKVLFKNTDEIIQINQGSNTYAIVPDYLLLINDLT